MAVAAATWFSQRSIGDFAQSQISSRRFAGEQAIEHQSDLVVQSIANALAHPLANSQYTDIPPVLQQAMRDDQTGAHGAHLLQWLSIADETGEVVQATPGAPTGAKLAELEKLLAGGVKDGDVVHARAGSDTDWVYGEPIKLADKQVGAIRIGVTTAGLEAELASTLRDASEAAHGSRDKLFVIAALVLGIGVIIAALQGVGVARPIRTLTVQAGRIAGGDLSTRVPEGRRDELGVLARTFNFMSDAMVNLL
ncbi:MAG TPA: HAMP domain-containing protein, partial [Kofleriaceae bacterium]